MLYLLLLASLLHLAALGTLGEPCGETVQTHKLTQALPQFNPVSDNVTQSYLTWTYMVIHIKILTMVAPRKDLPRDPRGDPPERPVLAPRAIQLTVKFPSFNWEGNTHEQFKTFKHRTEILMEGPYEDYKEPDKVAAILGWLGVKGHQVYASLDWTTLGKDKKKYQDVLDAFDAYFKPMQTIMHSLYQLGNIYSSQCKDQKDFMTKLKDLSKETGFKEPYELTKFLFVIHNTDSKVREYLIDKGDPTKTCSEFLQMARSVESMVKTENLSTELLGHVGKVPVSSIDRGRGSGRGRGRGRGRSSSRTYRSSTPGAKDCGRCGKRHHPKSAQLITKLAKGAKSRVTSNNIVKQRTQGVPTNLGALEGNNLRYPGGLSNHLVTLQGLIMSSVRTQYTLCLTKDPKHPNQIIFYLMKY